MGETAITSKRFGISGSTLKLIAIVTMLIDHIGAAILEAMPGFYASMQVRGSLYIADRICRATGRIAFPIFCFLLVEGFFHTRSRSKYALRLAVFALVSEIPFDLAFRGQWWYPGYQNVFFTLLIGLIMMIGIQYEREHVLPRLAKGKNIVALLLQTLIFVAAAIVAQLLHTDYGMWGIVAIFGMYILRFNRLYQCLVEALYFMSFEFPSAALSFLLLYFYNGKRGISLKYVFYLFYPVHLLVLYGIYITWFAK
ncbi:MAG: hypothetical protein PWP24_920 [Clostridiales bacterium]|nr:hypothetical protein [Clostridiales bacterium]